jgi:prevent-host-death family protein
MNTVGIRELKAHLSRHLRHVRSGVRLVVTERGRAVATIGPVVETDGLAWARALVAAGQARWDGGKPLGCRPPAPGGASATVSAAVLEDRR